MYDFEGSREARTHAWRFGSWKFAAESFAVESSSCHGTIGVAKHQPFRLTEGFAS